MSGTARVVLVVQLPQTAQSKGLENGTQNVYFKWKKPDFLHSTHSELLLQVKGDLVRKL